MLAPPTLITPRDSFQKFNAAGVTASRPSITGNAPPGPGTPRITIGDSAVPRRHTTHFSL